MAKPHPHRKQIVKWLRAGRSVTDIQDTAQQGGWRVGRATISAIRAELAQEQHSKGNASNPPKASTPPKATTAPPPADDLAAAPAGNPWPELLKVADDLDGTLEGDGSASCTALLQAARVRLKVLQGLGAQSQGQADRPRWRIVEFDSNDPDNPDKTRVISSSPPSPTEAAGIDAAAVMKLVLAGLLRVRRTGTARQKVEAAQLEVKARGLKAGAPARPFNDLMLPREEDAPVRGVVLMLPKQQEGPVAANVPTRIVTELRLPKRETPP